MAPSCILKNDIFLKNCTRDLYPCSYNFLRYNLVNFKLASSIVKLVCSYLS
ncbi:unnamed protein product [Moneuplotes crassus]|uniref:Uncharacterized protein n=1 Tax=Euplotes crassus TaxID=5936 RepID=A0AAD2D9K3_EUPCR|nr:unnamed protein product [Moneuplotes crassus]